MTTAERVVMLERILDNTLTILDTEITYQAANGPKPSYSLDGQSVSWDQWHDGMLDKVSKTQQMIRELQSAWRVRSRARS